MKNLLLIVIRLYWKLISKDKRRPCLFRETCSQYVYRQTCEHGFFEGFRAFSARYKKCRKGYKLYTTSDGFEMELADGTTIKEGEISLQIIKGISEEIQTYVSSQMILKNEIREKSSP